MRSPLSESNPASIVQENPGATILFSYWRSSCSWRVRIALNLKSIKYQIKTVNLLKGEQMDPEYTKLNPKNVLPTLIIDNLVQTQSIAILEYLEERRPETFRLIPIEANKRFMMRELVQIIASDIQPVQNLNVLKKVAALSNGGDEIKSQWAHDVINAGFTAFEILLGRSAGKYCVGDDLSLADVCLVPQVYNARRYNVDLDQFPIISRIEATLSRLDAFVQAHPDNQPDRVV